MAKLMKKKIKKILISVVSVVILLVILLFSISSMNNMNAFSSKLPIEEKLYVKLLTPDVRVISDTFQINGELVARKKVTISSTVEGIIEYFPWKEGDKVSINTLIAEVDKKRYTRDVNTSKASYEVVLAQYRDVKSGSTSEELRQAELSLNEAAEVQRFYEEELQRYETLYNKGAISKVEYEQARLDYISSKAKVDSAEEALKTVQRGPTRTNLDIYRAQVNQARINLENAQEKLAECSIYSTSSGKISNIYVQKGDLVNSGTSLAEVTDLSSIVVRFSIPESLIGNVKVGTNIEIVLDAYPDKVFKSKITRLFPNLNSESRTMYAEGKINDKKIEQVSGMFARVNVITKQIEDALTIPEEVILLDNQTTEKYVYIYNEGAVFKKNIQTGIEENHYVQIVSGIDKNSNIVLNNLDNLKDGLEVELAETIEDSTESVN